jgi:hypothetical protein
VEEKHVQRNICGRKYATTMEFRIHIPYILNFVFINNQKNALLAVLLLHSTTPTCSDARASPPGSCSVLLSYFKACNYYGM